MINTIIVYHQINQFIITMFLSIIIIMAIFFTSKKSQFFFTFFFSGKNGAVFAV